MLKKFAICFALMGVPQFAAAQSIQDQIIDQLQAQGFTSMQLSRTWLGRVRIISYRDGLRREVVFNPQTGEILRDFWESSGDDTAPTLFNPGGGWFSFGDDDDDDDDDHDDDDDDDDDHEDDDYDDDDDDDDRDRDDD